jgi:hypothetical protein
MKRDKFYFISLNLLKDKHGDVIEWVKKQADEREMSISSFCISLIKDAYKRRLNNEESDMLD